jgi:hypothetical protein
MNIKLLIAISKKLMLRSLILKMHLNQLSNLRKIFLELFSAKIMNPKTDNK